MVEDGEDIVRRLKLIPAHAVIEETHTKKYACFKCKKEDAEPVFVEAPSAPPVIPGSNATAEAISFLAEEKFAMYSPLYRMEQMLERRGIPLSRDTMSNWLLKACKLWLKPMWDLMKVLLQEENNLHADETTLQVLHEMERRSRATCGCIERADTPDSSS